MKADWHFQLEITSIAQAREALDQRFYDFDSTNLALQCSCSATVVFARGFPINKNILPFCFGSKQKDV